MMNAGQMRCRHPFPHRPPAAGNELATRASHTAALAAASAASESDIQVSKGCLMPLIVVHGGRLHVAQRTSIHKHTTSPVTGQRSDWQSAAVTMPPFGGAAGPPATRPDDAV